MLDHFTGAATDNNGEYIITIAPGKYTLRVTVIGYKPVESEVEVTADAIAKVNFEIETDILLTSAVLVTGTRAKARTAIKSPTPIDNFSAVMIERQGNGGMTEILKNIVPSYTATPLTGDGAAFVRPTSMRGLPPDNILILMNSKRRHRSSLISHFGAAMNVGSHAVDVGMIPGIAIKNLEVLRDGAAAQYGSDAIAGVMNFILKDNSEGIEIQATTGRWLEAPNGRGGELDLTVGANIGMSLTDNGFFNVSLEYKDSPELSRGEQHASAANGYKGWTGQGSGVDVDSWDPAMNWGRPASYGFRSVWNAGLKLANNVEAYSFGNYADTYGNYSFFYRAPGRSGALNPMPNDPNDPSKGNFSWGETFPNGFTPRLEGFQKDFSSIMGIKGGIDVGNGLDYDFSASYGTNRMTYTLNNSLNASWGLNSPHVFDIGDLKQSETNLNADFSYPMSEEVNVAFGFEWRDETYQMFEGQKESWLAGPWEKVGLLTDPDTGEKYDSPGTAANGMRGTSPEEAGIYDRQNTAAYVDAEWDVTEDLLIQAAGRFEDFSDFGTTSNGKLAARYSFGDILTLRGSASSGFRAPTPGQSNVITVVTSFDGVTGTQVQEGTIRPNSPLAKSLGGKALEPETAVNISVGFTTKPMINLQVTVDAYQIEVDSRIIKSRSIAVDPSIGADFTEAAFYTNALDTRTTGVDVVVVYNLGWDDRTSTRFSLAFNYNETEVTKQRQVNGIDPISKSLIFNIENNLPKQRVSFTVEQGLGKSFSAMVRANYYGKTIDERGDQEKVDPVALVDLEITYHVSSGLRIIGGANNIFNTYPTEIDTRKSQGMPYPRRSPISYNGGLSYLRLVYNF